MPIVDASNIQPGPLLALDPGSKTIGVASCGATRGLATPVETIQRTKFTADAARIFQLYDERKAVGLVIGLPYNMDGTEGARAQSSRALARNLLGLRDIPIIFQDERLSTFEATEALISAGMRRDRRKQVIDAHAAANILRSVLDRLEHI
ncbi:Holliday junction resolvase RuvX [Maricaulis sp.]|uniref:Holliday junction resolvase RuvX n=1 Tax=Maricaulis sp. TaxID=1486257 RepID=UPI003A946E9A